MCSGRWQTPGTHICGKWNLRCYWKFKEHLVARLSSFHSCQEQKCSLLSSQKPQWYIILMWGGFFSLQRIWLYQALLCWPSLPSQDPVSSSLKLFQNCELLHWHFPLQQLACIWKILSSTAISRRLRDAVLLIFNYSPLLRCSTLDSEHSQCSFCFRDWQTDARILAIHRICSLKTCREL